MRPYIFVCMALCWSCASVFGQSLTFDHGKVEFHTASIMSDIEAVSEEMEVSLDVASGDVEIRIPIASFEFEYEMMQEHFNEDYLESEKFPEAVFTGKLEGDISGIEEASEMVVSGQMAIHGVTQQTRVIATVSKKDDMTRVKCTFPIVFKDYGVDEPSILTKSVAKDVEVKVLIYLK